MFINRVMNLLWHGGNWEFFRAGYLLNFGDQMLGINLWFARYFGTSIFFSCAKDFQECFFWYLPYP